MQQNSNRTFITSWINNNIKHPPVCLTRVHLWAHSTVKTNQSTWKSRDLQLDTEYYFETLPLAILSKKYVI